MIVLCILMLWGICSVVGYGLMLGSFEEKYPWMEHRAHCRMFALFGPCAVIAGLILGGLNFRLKARPRQEKWEIYQKKYPTLAKYETIDNFDLGVF